MSPIIQILFRARKLIADAIIRFQDNCTHFDHRKFYGSSGGNYDPSDNKYWTNFVCNNCEKHWTEEGSK